MHELGRRRLLAGGLGGGLALASCSSAGAPPSAGAQAAGIQPPVATNVKDAGVTGRPGAVGDGQADDTDAIQAAIDEAAWMGVGGLNLFLPPGVYRVTRPIELRTGNHLFGMVPGGDLFADGRPYAEIDGTGVTTGPVLRNAGHAGTGNDSIVLRNLRVRGPAVGASDHPTFLLASSGVAGTDGCHNVLVEGCTFWGGGQGAVSWVHTSISWFVRNWIGGDGQVGPFGLRLDRSPDNEVAGNQMTTGSRGTDLGAAGDVVQVVGCDHNLLHSNFVFYGAAGIVVEGARHVVQGNRIDTNWREGLVVRGTGHLVSGNVVHTNGRDAPGTRTGILLDAGTALTKVVANATETDNPAEPFAPCQVPGVTDRSGRTDNEVGFSGPVR